MASSYSSNLRLTKPATGELSGTWGDVVNTDLELIEDAISGYVSVAMGDANTTLSTSNGAADEARNMVVQVTGAHTAVRDLIIPAAEKVYIVKNATTGGYAVTVKVSGQTGASVPNGACRLLFCNGTTTYSAGNFLDTASDNAFTAQQTISLASTVAVPLELISTFDDALTGPILSLYRDNNSGEADGDAAGAIFFYGRDSAGNKELYAGIRAIMDDVTSTTEDGSLSFSVVTAGTLAYELTLTGAALTPVAAGGLTIGTASLPFGSAFLAASAGIDFGNGDVTIDHTTNTLNFSGASSGYVFDTGNITNNGGGVTINNGQLSVHKTADTVATFNRNSTDGVIIDLQQAGNTEGLISVSGTTVTYGSFCGVHFSQLSGRKRKPIPIGTVMETINEKCEWPGEENDQLARCKVSDTPGSPAVYGVFMGWDDDDDFNVASLGAYLIRVEPGTKLEPGMLLESAGNGMARPQLDKAILSSTVAKVTAAVPVVTYDDGSYTIPCTLHCG
jgi:hypothetical protein